MKNTKGEVTSTSIDTTNYQYDASGGYVLTGYQGWTHSDGTGVDIHTVQRQDKDGKIISGERKIVDTKPGEEPKTTYRKFVDGRYVEIGFTPVLDETAAEPGNGAANETAYLPDVAGPCRAHVTIPGYWET